MEDGQLGSQAHEELRGVRRAWTRAQGAHDASWHGEAHWPGCRYAHNEGEREARGMEMACGVPRAWSGDTFERGVC